MRSLVATQARRTTVVALALSLNLVIQLMNLLDVFDGAATWVLIAVITITFSLLGVAIVVLVLNLRERRARSDR
jgi:hypothetical protein